MKRSLLLSIVFVFSLIVLGSAAFAGGKPKNPPGNNGTLKVHEKNTPSGTESNDPKVCKFNFEGFGFDSDQEGIIEITTPSDTTVIASTSFGPTDSNGYYATTYFNDGGDSVPDGGPYKATLYGKDTQGAVDHSDEKAKSKNFKVSCEEDNEFSYCDPAERPRGQSIGEWVPKDVNCVEPSVNAVCGALEGTVDNQTPLNYGISWSEGSPDYNFNTSLPASFPEDYNGGNVTVYYWVVGAEADYVTGRNIPNYWEQNAASVTIDTDCEENGGQGGGTPTTPVTPSGTTTPTQVSQPVIQQPAQVSAPPAGVNAGEGGGAGSVIAPVTALMGSLGSLAYGVIRLRRFGA